MATREELRVQLRPTLRPHAQPRASEPHLASFCPMVYKAPHSMLSLPEGEDVLFLQARDTAVTEPLSKLCGGRGAVVFLSFSFFCFSFTKYFRSLGKTVFVSPCENVILDGLPAGPGLPSVRLETTKRRRVSAQRRHGSLGADDPRFKQNKRVIV